MAKGKRCCDAVMWIKEEEDHTYGMMVTYVCRTCGLELPQLERK